MSHGAAACTARDACTVRCGATKPQTPVMRAGRHRAHHGASHSPRRARCGVVRGARDAIGRLGACKRCGDRSGYRPPDGVRGMPQPRQLPPCGHLVLWPGSARPQRWPMTSPTRRQAGGNRGDRADNQVRWQRRGAAAARGHKGPVQCGGAVRRRRRWAALLQATELAVLTPAPPRRQCGRAIEWRASDASVAGVVPQARERERLVMRMASGTRAKCSGAEWPLGRLAHVVCRHGACTCISWRFSRQGSRQAVSMH